MNLFTYENYTLRLNREEYLHIKEFAELFSLNFNKGEPGDKDGRKRDRAHKLCVYLYLVYDWKSPYSEYSDQEKHEAALEDAKIEDKDVRNETFEAAIVKYLELQDTRMVKLLKDAYHMIDELRLYFRTTKLTDTDPMTGKYINSAKEAMTNLAGLSKTVEGLKELENLVKKEKQQEKGIRAGAQKGMFDE